MKGIDQALFINQLEIEAEIQLKEVLTVFQNLPESTLLQPSAAGGWSIAQCFEHLNSYAEYYLPELRRALTHSTAVSSPVLFEHSWLGNYFIKMMDIEKSKKKYKAIKRHSPGTTTNPYAVISTYIQHMEDLLSLLKEAEIKNLKKTSIKTSISSLIRLNAGDSFLFVLTHNKRHIGQAKKNL